MALCIVSQRYVPARYEGKTYVPEMVLVVLEIDGARTPELSMSPHDATEGGRYLIQAGVRGFVTRTAGRVV